ncbi:hypothetical protein, partial [Ralstonia pseudosolanacearum]|uniref:hypothetical protein n=1 Tax=Ralstonia pseudosolanacearum TaxID=1310165 RepID=UPI001CB9C06E
EFRYQRFKHRPQFLADSSSRHAPHDTVCLAPCPVVLAALSQNGLTGRWEVPTSQQAARAQKMFDELGIKNITVRVVKNGG